MVTLVSGPVSNSLLGSLDFSFVVFGVPVTWNSLIKLCISLLRNKESHLYFSLLTQLNVWRIKENQGNQSLLFQFTLRHCQNGYGYAQWILKKLSREHEWFFWLMWGHMLLNSVWFCVVFLLQKLYFKDRLVTSLVWQMSEFPCHLHDPTWILLWISLQTLICPTTLENPGPTMETELESNCIRSACIVQHIQFNAKGKPH